MTADIGTGAGKRGSAGFDELARERSLKTVEFHDWQKIDEAEMSRAREGAPREKFVDIVEMIEAAGKD